MQLVALLFTSVALVTADNPCKRGIRGPDGFAGADGPLPSTLTSSLFFSSSRDRPGQLVLSPGLTTYYIARGIRLLTPDALAISDAMSEAFVMPVDVALSRLFVTVAGTFNGGALTEDIEFTFTLLTTPAAGTPLTASPITTTVSLSFPDATPQITSGSDLVNLQGVTAGQMVVMQVVINNLNDDDANIDASLTASLQLDRAVT